MATKVIALHTVMRTLKPGVAATRDTAAVRPVTDEMKPGTVFVIDDDSGPNSELAQLLAAKAVSTEVKGGVAHIAAPGADGPGVPVEKTDDSPMDKDQRAEWVERGKKVNVNITDNWKPGTIRTKVLAAERAAAEQAEKDSAAGGDGSNLV